MPIHQGQLMSLPACASPWCFAPPRLDRLCCAAPTGCVQFGSMRGAAGAAFGLHAATGTEGVMRTMEMEDIKRVG